jgi:hypothetical protein
MLTATETSAATNCTRLGLKADRAPVAIANTAADRADPAAKTQASAAAQVAPVDPVVRTVDLKAMAVAPARKPTPPSNPPLQTRRGQDPHQHANSNRNERGHQNQVTTLLF